MNAFVLTLAHSDATLDHVGGKGMSLARLRSAGLPVPDGFHVTTEAYRRFVAMNALQPRIVEAVEGVSADDTDALEEASRRISAWFAEGRTPPEVVAAVRAAYAALGERAVAVRSSATAEDLPGASFAGQQETYLNIRGAEAVLAAVKHCWASLWTARAIAYRLKDQIDQGAVALAVVVQELVDAEAAGIMFTADPVSGRRDELVVNAAWGLGEAVVSGAVTPDTLTIKKATGRVLRRETAVKAVMTVRTAEGTREEPVPGPRQRRRVLSDAEAVELAHLGVRIEQLYGMPMDIEWVLAGGRFAIVQARPITALPPEWVPPDPGVLYSRGSLAEHTPGPVTPLFATLGLGLANAATAELWATIIGAYARDVVPAEGAYRALNGYVYLSLRLGPRNFWRVTWSALANLNQLLGGSVARWQAARAELAGVVVAWERRSAEELAPSELLEGVRAVFGAACRYFTAIQSTLPAAALSEALLARLYDGVIRRRGDPEASALVMGFDTVALRAEQSLFDLAAWVRADPQLSIYIGQTASAELAAELGRTSPPEGISAAAWAEWGRRFQHHLDEFCRTAYEFDFANPTPQETPEPMLDVVKTFLAGGGEDPYARQREATTRREHVTKSVLGRVGPLRRWVFLRLLRWAQATGPMREDSIFDMGMGHPVVRRMLGELGRRLVAGGAIEQADDIYWLEQAEVEGLAGALERGEALPELAGCIPERKARWETQRSAAPPVVLPERTAWSRLFHGGEAVRRDGALVLKGVGTSGGRVTAPACVLHGPQDFASLRSGDVLVAVTTTPAWTPLFTRAAAVVTDIGGPLSHSSIVAREYGIPAVMAARSATRAIRSGQMVTVDGTAGTVTVAG